MEFRILGPLQVVDGEVDVRLRSGKERALLAVLLLHAGTVVSRDRLIEELWGESPPPTAGKALNVHVSHLRKALARNGAEMIATRPPGYVLEVEPEQLDAARFDRLVAEARERVATGEIESACGLLRAALALWRGPALDGVVLEAAARNEVGRLEELRLAAQMNRIDCELALGSHEQLIGELEALVAEHPLRERLRGQLMLAFYRAGRQADALDAYRAAREALVAELGIELSVPLQRLERAILNQDASLEVPTGVARAETAVAAELPMPATPLIGRERELVELGDLLRGGRIVTLLGPGGVGKTRLALEFARRSSRKAVFVDLAPLQDSEQVLPAVALGLGVREAAGRPLADAIAARERALGECLLVLDTCEHVVDAAAALAAVVASSAKLQLLATSRAPLRVAAERVYRLEPLPDVDAVALFVERARRIIPSAEPDETVAEICRRLDRLPLAIEMAAARTNVLAPPQILERLAHRLDMLTSPTRDTPHRQVTLYAAIEWSYDLLDADGKRLFAQLGVFTGSFTLEAAEEVCGATVDAIAALVDNSLVRHDGARFTMLDTIRAHALALLEESDDESDVRRRHALYFLRSAEGSSWDVDVHEWASPAELEVEHDNLRAALRWSRDAGIDDIHVRFAAALARFWDTGGHLSEGDAWLKAACTVAERGAHPLHASLLVAASLIAGRLGDSSRAARLADNALRLHRARGDTEGILRALHAQSLAASRNGDYERATSLLAERRAIALAVGDRRHEAAATSALGGQALRRGDHEQARELLEHSLASFRELGYELYAGQTLCMLGMVSLLRGDYAAARDPLEQSLKVAQRYGYPEAAAYSLSGLAGVAAGEGDLPRAEQLLAAADVLLDEVGTTRMPFAAEIDRRTRSLVLTGRGSESFNAARERARDATLAEIAASALGADAEPTGAHGSVRSKLRTSPT